MAVVTGGGTGIGVPGLSCRGVVTGHTVPVDGGTVHPAAVAEDQVADVLLPVVGFGHAGGGERRLRHAA
ncbi:MAG TPA: hypothetical protein VI365_25970 [Trebonia sp.]